MLKSILGRRNMLSYRNLCLYKEKNVGNGENESKYTIHFSYFDYTKR